MMALIKNILKKAVEMICELILSVGVYFTLTMLSDSLKLSETEIGVYTLLFAIVFANLFSFTYIPLGNSKEEE